MSFLKSTETPWGVVHLMPDIEHELFFDYLTISPSYQLAHEIKDKCQTKIEKELRKTNFIKVFEIYEVVGPIFFITFDEWWTKKGQFIFVDKSKFSKLNFTINMLKSKNELMFEIGKVIDIYQQILTTDDKKIEILKNKINIDNLNFLKHLVVIKGAQEYHEKKNLPDWMVGVYAADFRPNSKYAETFINRYPDLHTSTFTLDRKKNNERDRLLLGQLVSRQLKESLAIAENAAHGVFPDKSLKSEVAYKDFDYDKCRFYFWSRKVEANGEDLTYSYTSFYRLNYYKWKKFEKKYGEDALPHPLTEEQRKEFLGKIDSGEIDWSDL